MIVKKKPAQDLTSLVVVLRIKLTQFAREVVQDDTGLTQPDALVLEHGHLPHLVHGAILWCIDLPIEVIDEARRPVSAT